MDLRDSIRSIPDYPEEGIIFRDITTLLKNPEALKAGVDQIQELLKDVEFDVVVAPESRGFIFGMPIAYNMGKGFVPIRKEGKLPCETMREEYDLEYGSAVIEVHTDALQKGQKVIIIDDLLATGGTAKAMIDLIHKLGAEVSAAIFLIELDGLGGREVLDGVDVKAILNY